MGIYVLSTTDAAAPQGEYRRVTTGGFASSTGTWTVGPAFSAVIGAGDVVLFLYGLSRENILDAANDIQRELFLPRYTPLTLITDGNMEASGQTNWPDAVGTPTQTKETTEVLTGTQSLKIVTTTVDHAVTSASLPVTEGEQLLVWSPIRVTAGSLRLSLYDVTNSVEIDGATLNEDAWTEVRLPSQTVPADCQNVAVRYVAKTAATTAYVDHCGVLSYNRSYYSLPSQVADAVDLEEVCYQMAGLTSEADDAYMAFAEAMQPWGGRILRDHAGVNSHRVDVGRVNVPLYLKFWAALTVFSADTDTTPAPQDMVVQGTVGVLKRKKAEAMQDGEARNRLREDAVRHSRIFDEMKRGLGLIKPARRVYVPTRVPVSGW